MGSVADAEAITYINGKRYALPPGRAEATLLQFLRESGLTGTKLGCGEGGCGACTVMVSSYEDSQLVHRSINACLCPLYAVEGMHVVTCEGISNPRDGLHPVQEKLSKAHGSQCGFCTPGFVMSMYSLLRSKGDEALTHEEIEDALAGNLCRCTGYRPILEAFSSFAKTDNAGYVNGGAAPAGGKVCPTSGLPCDCAQAPEKGGCGEGGCGAGGCGAGGCGGSATAASQALEKKISEGDKPRAAVPEPIFPAELRKRPMQDLCLPGPKATWYRPTTLASLLKIKAKSPAAKLIVGNTEVGIEMKFKAASYPVLVGVNAVPELNAVQVSERGVTFGASVTLTRLLQTCKQLVKDRPAHQVSGFKAIAEQLRWFAGTQIRNAASIGGNVCTASPISDLNPLWVATNSVFTCIGEGTSERQVAAKDFYLGYRKIDLQGHEVLSQVFIPFTQRYEYVKEYKQAHRRDDDIAIVNAGMRVRLEPTPGGWVVRDAHISYGGVAPKTISAPATIAALVGGVWGQQLLQKALEAVARDVAIDANAPGGMVEFRRSLASSFLFKFFLQVSEKLRAEADAVEGAAQVPEWPASWGSAAQEYSRPASHGLQYFDAVHPESVVGQPYRHMAADLQVCGEARYCDDWPCPPGMLHAALIKSERAHARILSVDTSAAEAVLGVAGVYTAKDVPGSNRYTVVIEDEEIYASEKVTCINQPIGVVVAETEAIAREAARLVRVEYEDLPAIYSIKDAIEAGSFFSEYGGGCKTLQMGDPDAVFASGQCEYVREGEMSIGGQEHFYLEPQGALVIPQENDEILSIASTQGPHHHQHVIAHALGLPQSKVVVKVKRLGGGFGGKESRATLINVLAAPPAWHTRKAVRLILDRDEDMGLTGHRHPFHIKYKVGFTKEGRVLAVDLQLYSNGGNSFDLSPGVMDRALLHCDSCYLVPNFRVTGRVCRTNLPSNTAFRGFGGPQGMVAAEAWLDEVATTLGLEPEAVRRLHMYDEGDVTHFTQRLEGCQARACFDGVVAQADFGERRQAAAEFNANNRYRKRGICVLPTKFGIAFTVAHLNQGGALVHIYTDGSVLVTHGGVEMGQGLHTKVAQIAAERLGVPLSRVFISETATDKVANMSPTAASASSDLYGSAVADACEQLNARLKPVKEANPGLSFKEIVGKAYFDRVDLSAHGFFKTPDISGFGGTKPFNYLCYGAACSEVELDVLTGDFTLLRADIVMDVGKSLNPAIDIGQVEGAFVQGVGWSCLEEVVWGDKEHPWVRPGRLFTAGPGTYKIPTANDIPIDFRVTLLRNAPCHRTPEVHSSKAVGEPPLYLGASAFWALKQALYAARADAGVSGYFHLDSPATPERLRMACMDDIAGQFVGKDFVPKLSC